MRPDGGTRVGSAAMAAAAAVAIAMAAAAAGYGLSVDSNGQAPAGAQLVTTSSSTSNSTSQAAQIEQLQSIISSLEANVSALQGQMNSTQGTVQRLESEVASLNATVQMLTGELTNSTSCSGICDSRPSGPDCVYSPSCTARLASPVSAGDMLLLLVEGYAYSPWHPLEVNDTLGTSFSQYNKSLSWTWYSPVSNETVYISDYMFYGTASKGGSYDQMNATFAGTASHTELIAIDVTSVTGQDNLVVYGGNSSYCSTASSCPTTLSTPSTSLVNDSFAAAYAYTGIGGPIVAGQGWTALPTQADFMAGEYSTSLGGSATVFPFSTMPSKGTWGDVGIVIGPAPAPP